MLQEAEEVIPPLPYSKGPATQSLSSGALAFYTAVLLTASIVRGSFIDDEIIDDEVLTLGSILTHVEHEEVA